MILHHAPVSTSQSILLILECMDLEIHAGHMCSEFLDFIWHTSMLLVCSFFTVDWGSLGSYFDMKKGGS